jgi:hypothetical protein
VSIVIGNCGSFPVEIRSILSRFRMIPSSSFIKLRGLELAKLYYESQSAAVDRIEKVQADESIACNF